MKDLYLEVVKKFEANSTLGIIEKKKCIGILGYMLHVPKKTREKFLDNMVRMKLLESVSHRSYKCKNVTSEGGEE